MLKDNIITLDPYTNIFPKCPRCERGVLILRFETYKDEGRNYVRMFLICNSCGTEYVLNMPFIEW